MPPKLKSKTNLESQDSVSDAAEATQEGLVPAMIKQFERNIADFLQGEFASDDLFGQEEGKGNIDDDDIHVPIAVEFQAND